MRLHHLAPRNAPRPQAPDDLVSSALPAPLRQEGVDPVVLASASACCRECRVRGPLRTSDRLAQRRPLLVGGDRDRDPRVVLAPVIGTGSLIEVLRLRTGPSI